MKAIVGLALLVALGVCGLFLRTTPSAAEERERERGREKGGAAIRGASIERIMKSVHGKNGLMKKLAGLMEAKPTNWAAVRAATKAIAPLAADLGKRKPDKGPKESWAELTEVYADFAKELDDAAAKKDKDALKDAFTNLNGGCNKCHDRHRGR
jgi:cytochrome c556